MSKPLQSLNFFNFNKHFKKTSTMVNFYTKLSQRIAIINCEVKNVEREKNQKAVDWSVQKYAMEYLNTKSLIIRNIWKKKY